MIHQERPENSCRPAVDVLFRSVAQVYGRHVLAVVMTGMGQDGLRGCEHIRDAGGQIIVQDEASSVVWGMPGFVVRAGLADQILPLSALGPEIIRACGTIAEPPRSGAAGLSTLGPRVDGDDESPPANSTTSAIWSTTSRRCCSSPARNTSSNRVSIRVARQEGFPSLQRMVASLRPVRSAISTDGSWRR